MNAEIANAMSGYLETLYNLNKKTIKLSGSNIIDDFTDNKKEILDIIQDIPRLVPYSQNSKTQRLEYKSRDGLLEYSKEIPYLLGEYEDILKSNYELLYKIKQIRNKYEHKMHAIKHKSSSTGSMCLFEFEFEINGSLLEVSAGEFIKLLKQINILFSKMVNDICTYAHENGKQDYPYYRKITKFDFNDFNLLYESSLLRNVGKIMHDF